MTVSWVGENPEGKKRKIGKRKEGAVEGKNETKNAAIITLST